MGKWNHRSRYHRRRSPERWYSERHPSSSSYGYGEDDGIPVWEKRFCEVIGSVPWQKVVEAADFKSWYSGNVISWNDSACQQTFHNEKMRFWSQVNGLRCDVSLPDPDLYISEVDWDTFVDPELIRDLELAYFAPPDEVNTGFKRGRRDKNWGGCDSLLVEETLVLETPWKGSDQVADINALGKNSNGWILSESGTGHPKDRVSSWEAKPSCVNEKANGGCLTTEEWRENQWETKDKGNDSWENSHQGNEGWDMSGHQNKKAKGSESVPAEECKVLDNPWEAQPSCRKETAEDITWGGCSGKGWEDRGRNNESWGSGGWENQDWPSKRYSRDRGWNNDSWGSGGWENQEWRSKGYSRDMPEPKVYNPRKAGFVSDNAALRDYGANAGGWQTRRPSETKQRIRDVKRSSDGWDRQNKERDDLYGYRSNYKNSWHRRDDYQKRKVHFSAK